MRKRLSTEELRELLKKELVRKELEFEVGRHLKHSYEQIHSHKQLTKNKNPLGSIHFFGTLIIGYSALILIWSGAQRVLFLPPGSLAELSSSLCRSLF